MNLINEINMLLENITKSNNFRDDALKRAGSIPTLLKEHGWKYKGEAPYGKVYTHKDLKGHKLVHIHKDNKPTSDWVHYDHNDDEIKSGKGSNLQNYLKSKQLHNLKSDMIVSNHNK